jgi:hypothetical protein
MNRITQPLRSFYLIFKDKVFLAFLFGDLLLIFFHILYIATDIISTGRFSIARDGGYGEMFQYFKEFFIFVLFVLLGFRKKKLLYFILGFLFLYLLVDDSLKIHERLGALLAEWLNFQPSFGLRAIDFGEILVSAFFGGLFILAIGISLFLSDVQTRMVGIWILIAIFFFAFFGIALDMLEIAAQDQVLSQIIAIMEEGGEMVVMSVVVWYAFRLNFPARQQTQAASI